MNHMEIFRVLEAIIEMNGLSMNENMIFKGRMILCKRSSIHEFIENGYTDNGESFGNDCSLVNRYKRMDAYKSHKELDVHHFEG